VSDAARPEHVRSELLKVMNMDLLSSGCDAMYYHMELTTFHDIFIDLNNIQQFSSFLTEVTLSVHYKQQPFKGV
jgi:hypothetical protein